MAPVQSKRSLSAHQSIVDHEPTSTIRKRYNKPFSFSPNSKPHHPTITLNLTSSQKARINQEFRHSLIACVIGKNIYHEKLALRLRRHLPLTGDLNVFPLGLGFFALKFSNPSDYSEALKERPWLIPHLCIRVFPWTPNFKPSKAFISFVDVWIRLPELGMEHYNREMFKNIAKATGACLVKIDPVTESKQKCMFARICIRITLSNPLIYYIHIEESRQNIVYEGLDSLCSVCGRVDILRHDCLNQNNPSASSRSDPHQQNPCPLQAIDPSSGSGLGLGLDSSCSVCECVYDLKHDCLSKNNPSGSSGHGPHQQNPCPLQAIDPSWSWSSSSNSSSGSGFGLDSLCSVCGCVYDPKHDCLSKNNPSGSSGHGPHQQNPYPLQAIDPRWSSSSSSSSSSCSGFGLDSLSSVCGCVYDLKHDCLNKNNPSGSSGHDPHQQNPCSWQAIDSSSSSGLGLDSKKPLIHSLPSLESALGSKSQEKDPFPELNLKDYPKLKMGKVVENEKKTLPNFPRESSTTTMKTTEYVPLAVSLVEDQFRAAKTSSPTKLALHNNGYRSSSAIQAGLNFFSTVVQRLTTEKKMINTPSGEVNVVDSWPTVYTIDPTTMSLGIDFSEVPTTTGSNQTRYAINFVLNSRRENENEVDSKAASMPPLCSKKMLCWNFGGKDIVELIRALKDLIGRHEPSIVLIFGSKISSSDADEVVRDLAFNGFYCRKPDWFDGGVWMMLSQQDAQIEVSSYSPEKVFASVHFHCKLDEPELYPLDEDTKTSLWGDTFFYASTRLMDIMMAYCGEEVNKY